MTSIINVVFIAIHLHSRFVCVVLNHISFRPSAGRCFCGIQISDSLNAFLFTFSHLVVILKIQFLCADWVNSLSRSQFLHCFQSFLRSVGLIHNAKLTRKVFLIGSLWKNIIKKKSIRLNKFFTCREYKKKNILSRFVFRYLRFCISNTYTYNAY